MSHPTLDAKGPILIGIGANLPSERFGGPLQACEAALAALNDTVGVEVVERSSWYESEPVPVSDQPWFINGVARIETTLSPLALLDTLHAIESRFGRVRTVPNAPRVLDLDLLAYGDVVMGLGENEESGPQIPHPRLQTRAFVVLPLAEVVPDWVHPASKRSVAEMVAELPSDQVCRPLK